MRPPSARAVTFVAVLSTGALLAQSAANDPGARDLFKELIEINTTDSVGNVTKAAEAVAVRLKAAGFADADIQVLGPNPRKGNLVARYRGTGARRPSGDAQRRPILLLAHLDVVEARREDWTTDPFTFIDSGITLAFVDQAKPSPPSPLTPDVMGPIESITRAMWPGVVVVPTMSTGATDGLYLRNAGIPTYGVEGMFNDMDDVRAHGKDERLGVKPFFEGVEFHYRLIKALASRVGADLKVRPCIIIGNWERTSLC